MTREQQRAWETKPLRGDTFSFVIESAREEDKEVVEAIRVRKIGEAKESYNCGSAFAAEWGYSFTHLNGCLDGMGREIQAWYPTEPKTRQEALDMIRNFLMRQYVKESPHPWISMNGHYPWHHYAGEFGFDVLCSEIGENINNYQWHIALNRGAAKQYGIPWSIDFSSWNCGTVTDYWEEPCWPGHSLPSGGHSQSLMERAFYMAYLAGASEVVVEAGSHICFNGKTDKEGYLELSPFGKTCRRFYEYSQKHPNRGVCYTPFAIVLDYYHGAYSGLEVRKAFDYFPYGKGDEMTWSLVDMLWPGGWSGGWFSAQCNESVSMVNSPFGDFYDILLQNAPAELLSTYPCVLLSGNIHLSAEEVERYVQYVKEGGNLLLNRAYLAQFPQFAPPDGRDDVVEIPFGKGTVTFYGYDFDLTGLDIVLRRWIKRLIPVRVSAHILQMLNICEDKLLLTLINNSGVTKAPHEEPAVDTEEYRYVRITYTGEETIESMTDQVTGIKYPAVDNTVEIYMDSGGIAVLELQTA